MQPVKPSSTQNTVSQQADIVAQINTRSTGNVVSHAGICSGTLRFLTQKTSYKCNNCTDCHFENCFMIVMHVVQLPQIAMEVFALGQSHNLLLQDVVFKKILYFSCCLGFS